jgi:diguanylate cyclase (GGDEF)-like protein
LLPLWADGLLLTATAALGAYVRALRRRERLLRARLESRDRGGHFLGESPDTRQIVRHAFDAAAEILPVARFDLYRIDSSGRVEEVWSFPGPEAERGAEPVVDLANPRLGQPIDSARLLELTATETDRSFAPRDLLSGGPHPCRLRLPLYSGDRLIAYLALESPEPIGEERRAEIRALLPPLTASLHALRNWTIAVTDELSGLASRRYFETRLAEEWSRRERYGGALAVACFDLDRFKAINDTWGHPAGDRVIRAFGEIVRSAVRGSDLACRYGGEEFAILFPQTSAGPASAVAERIRRGLERESFEGRGGSRTARFSRRRGALCREGEGPESCDRLEDGAPRDRGGFEGSRKETPASRNLRQWFSVVRGRNREIRQLRPWSTRTPSECSRR